jgi:hypothetical protein
MFAFASAWLSDNMLEVIPTACQCPLGAGEIGAGLPGRPARRLNKTPVVDPAMPRLVDHHASRALKFRERAIELALEAKREDDPGQRRFLLDKARTLVNVADALAPLPPDEPQVFRERK